MFTNVDGTLANTLILDHYIRDRREKGKAYCGASLDIRKAFDIVSHWSLNAWSMMRHSIDDKIRSYIMTSLTRSYTNIKVGHQTNRNINFRRGVKQGDPLSPILFNLVIDDMLDDLNRDADYGGSLRLGIRVSAMAFADDVIVMEDSGAKLVLSKISSFMADRGMNLNLRKCSVIATFQKNKTIVIRTNPDIQLGGTPLRALSSLDAFKYLGHESSAAGVLKPNNSNLTVWLARLEKASLKPD